MENTWFDLPGYEDKYEISTSSEVRIKSRDIIGKDGQYITTLDSKILDIKTDAETLKPYVILHDGTSYQKKFLEDILNESVK